MLVFPIYLASWYMKNITFCLPVLFPFLLGAQTNRDGLELSRTEFSFPKAENWVSAIDTIEVTNVTDKKIHLLKRNGPRGFELRYPNKSVDPGKTEILEIIFNPKEKGKFNFVVPVYHSASQTPIDIIYKGEIISFDEFAEAACPSFTKPNLKPIGFELEITVLDSATKNPIGNSFIEIATGEFYTQRFTNTEGIYKQNAGINRYFILAEQTGYLGRSVSKHINPKNRKITLELPPIAAALPAPPTAASITITPVSTTTIIPIEATSITPMPSSFSLTEFKKNNIVFLIDKSSSMNKPDCMPLLQAAMTELARMTRPEDRITIITYANEARVALPGTSGSEHDKIIAVINQLKCGGRTERGKAIHTAYNNAEENFIKGGVNQIIIATDGGCNGISENEEELMKLADSRAKAGISLSVLAFGQNKYGKAHITRLAKQGGGFYTFIENTDSAQSKLSEQIKIQSKVK